MLKEDCGPKNNTEEIIIETFLPLTTKNFFKLNMVSNNIWTQLATLPSYGPTLHSYPQRTHLIRTLYLLGTNNTTRINFTSQLVHAPVLSKTYTDAHLLSTCGKFPLRLRWHAELVFPRHTTRLVSTHFISFYLYFILFDFILIIASLPTV